MQAAMNMMQGMDDPNSMFGSMSGAPGSMPQPGGAALPGATGTTGAQPGATGATGAQPGAQAPGGTDLNAML
jgi:hypothetical protein